MPCSSSKKKKFVLKKRREERGGQLASFSGGMEAEPGQLDGHSDNLRRETKPAVDLPASDPREAAEGLKAQAVTTANEVAKKEKARQRVRDDVVSVGPDDTKGIEKKKKKVIEAGLSRDGGESYGKVAGKSIGGLGHGQNIVRTESQRRGDGVAITSDLNSFISRQPSVVNLEFPQLLSHLQELAVDPFYAIEGNAPAVVLQVFRKFRIQVSRKSLRTPESEHDMVDLQAIRVAAARSLLEPGAGNADMAFGKKAKDHREPSSSALKPLKPRPKPDDPAKASWKRGPSARQEKLNEKKVKKMNQITVEKKTGISLKIPEGQHRNQKHSSTATATASAASAKPTNKGAETIKKQEPPPPPPLSFSPTALVLKFSLGTSLPSVAKLKASFAVFGPLVKDTTRVHWKSNSCKVIFERKPHAQAALNYARKNDLLLGPFRCHIRELDPATLKPLSSPSGGPSLRLGNGGQRGPLPHQQQLALTGQLKSILKKPRNEGGGSVGDAAREPPQRVKFTQDGRDTRVKPPAVPAASSGNGGSYVAGFSSSRPLMDPRISKNPKSSGLLPPPPPLPLHSPLSIPPPAMEKPRLLPPPPLPPPISFPKSSGLLPPPPPLPLHFPLSIPPPSMKKQRLLPPPPLPPPISLPPPPRAADGPLPSITPPPPPHVTGGQLPPPPPLPLIVDRFEAHGPVTAQLNQPGQQHHGQHAAVEARNEVDVSNQLLILLKRCSDIVSNIKSSLGYLPYHPL